MTAGSAGKPRTVRVRYASRTYERDLARCRRALLDRAMRDGLNGVHQFAVSIGVRTTTVAGFFSGAVPCSEDLARRIVNELGLTWEDVHREVTGEVNA